MCHNLTVRSIDEDNMKKLLDHAISSTSEVCVEYIHNGRGANGAFGSLFSLKLQTI